MKIALTGGMGSGKSTTGRLLSDLLGVDLHSADEICRDLMQPGNAGWQELRQRWGGRYVDARGEIDRPLLRQAVFEDLEVRTALEGILHPLVRKIFSERAAHASARKRNFLAEVPLLFEVGWSGDFDWSVAVLADEQVCAERIALRDGVTLDQAVQAMDTQMPSSEKALAADSVLDNSGTLAALYSQVQQLVRVLRQNPLFFS